MLRGSAPGYSEYLDDYLSPVLAPCKAAGSRIVSNLGAANAGDYQRFFLQDGQRYHHIFNPKTGYPALGKQSVTVIGPETLLCDALSTAVFVSRAPEEILQKYPEYGAVIVDSEGNISLLGKDYTFSVY